MSENRPQAAAERREHMLGLAFTVFACPDRLALLLVLAIRCGVCLFCETHRYRPTHPHARSRKPLAGTGRGSGRARARLVPPVPIALGAPLGQHHDLSARLVLLHAAMRFNDLIEMEGSADLNM